MWILFTVPCPTPDGHSAMDLYAKRQTGITAEMQDSAYAHGCRFHQAWYAEDGSAFYALAFWQTREGASAFFREWDIRDEPGEVAIPLSGEVGLVPLDLRPGADAGRATRSALAGVVDVSHAGVEVTGS